jgi:putative exporter of polyketide antibiotics
MAHALALAWRLHRWEIGAVAVAASLLSAGALWVASELGRLLAQCRAAKELVAPCGSLTEMGIVYQAETQTLMYIVINGMIALPYFAGVVLGAPLVSRELEHRTAQLGWPLAQSRARWLWFRLLPIALIGLVLLAIPAMAGEVLQRTLHPLIDPGASFEHYGSRGPLLALRFLPVVAVAALVGTLLGRQLPSVLVAAVVAGAMAFGLGLSARLWVEPDVQQDVEVYMPLETQGNLYVTTRYRDRDGTWMTDEEAFERMSWDPESGEPEPDPAEMPQPVLFMISRERYGDVVLRESVAFVGAGLALSGLLLIAVRRRRPG